LLLKVGNWQIKVIMFIMSWIKTVLNGQYKYKSKYEADLLVLTCMTCNIKFTGI